MDQSCGGFAPWPLKKKKKNTVNWCRYGTVAAERKVVERFPSVLCSISMV